MNPAGKTYPRILAINGSHHGNHGFTRFLLDLIFDGARESKAVCEMVTLADVNLNRCLGCDKCQKDRVHPVDPETFSPRCAWDGKDDGRVIFERMAAADIVIYATPVHVFGMSGLMKNFLDRFYAYSVSDELCVSESGLMFHFVDHRIVSKPFVALISCGNLENATPANTIHYFRTFSRFMDAPIAGMLVRNGASMLKKGKDPKVEECYPKAFDVYAAYHQAGRELALQGAIRKETERKANQEIVPVPFFHLLKQMPIRRFKEVFVERAGRLTGTSGMTDTPSE